MRYIALAALTLSITACAPSHQSAFKSGAQKHSAHHGTYSAYGKPSAPQHLHHYGQPSHGPAPAAYASMRNDYGYGSTTSIYPVGCGQIDVSNCAQVQTAAYAGGAPALRGRKGKSAYASIGAGSFDQDRGIYSGVIRAGIDGGYLGLEAEASKSFISGKSDITPTIEQKLGVDYSVAGFGVLRFPLGQRVRALGRFGYHFTKFDASVTTATTSLIGSDNVDDIAYGGGLEFDMTPKDSLRLDYTAYETDAIGRADSVTASYVKRF